MDNQIVMQIVVDERGRKIFDNEGRVCLHSNGILEFVSLDRLPPMFLHDADSDMVQTSTEDATTSFNGIASVDQNSDIIQTGTEESISQASTSYNTMETVEDGRAHWSRGKILTLIHSYKENRELFRSNSVKNSDVWRIVAENVQNFSAKQCEAKFKYLKSLYTKRKDNMGNNSSGARTINFDFFEEFDEIFHQEPNITPVAIASSSTIVEMEAGHATPSTHTHASPANLGEGTTSRPARKRKRTRLEIQMEKFHHNMELREQARERRMNRFLEQQEICTNRICDMMQKFIDKL